ncbi:START domain-containing protein [Marinobacter daepoensis]|uniref:START domain-containing protein n=1 Tax=Marinobacter daepoensis TaxID=262077 RepID=UPI0003FEB5FA|nr:START domain-containing protein [Marinobacter daepoensis]MBY6032248.1 hypothetical protein [Marinobacter daepoensis]
MKKRLPSLLTAVFLAVALPVKADAWEMNEQGELRTEVTTYVRSVEDSPIKQFRGVVETPHSALTALAVIDDISLCSRWIYNCQQAKYHYTEDGERRLWMMFDGVWPAADRDVVMQSEFVQQEPGGPVRVVSIGEPSAAPEQGGYVRIPMLNNSFYVEPLEDGWTRVTFTTHMNPGGLVPAWIANMVATDAPMRTLEGLKKMMELSPYRDYSAQTPPPELLGKHALSF